MTLPPNLGIIVRKVKALAERGRDGERQNAARMLRKLAEKHGLSQEDIDRLADEADGSYRLRVKGKVDDLALQVAGRITHEFMGATIKAHPLPVGVMVVIRHEQHPKKCAVLFENCLKACREGYRRALMDYRIRRNYKPQGRASLWLPPPKKPHRRSWMIGFFNGVASNMAQRRANAAMVKAMEESLKKMNRPKRKPEKPNPFALVRVRRASVPLEPQPRVAPSDAHPDGRDEPDQRTGPAPEPEPEPEAQDPLDQVSARAGFLYGSKIKVE